jgi:hypothetical protein
LETSLGQAIPSVETIILVPFGLKKSKVSLNIVYATIPQGLAGSLPFKGVLFIEIFVYRSALVTIGEQIVEI